ncbi:hypothetical protein ACIQWR_24485 [Streptomyces sp. NPDC098789]|uniref:hypothetical protein n=1 Tax=Streptomyces sp. NPDC098789 TaxID=3366098 RepID=UPI003828521E
MTREYEDLGFTGFDLTVTRSRGTFVLIRFVVAVVRFLPASDKAGGSEQAIHNGVQPPAVGGWQSKGVIHLGGGWTASVDVDPSARTARADIAGHGHIMNNLQAYGKNTSITIDGRTFTLTPAGTISKAAGSGPDTTVPAPSGTPAG